MGNKLEILSLCTSLRSSVCLTHWVQLHTHISSRTKPDQSPLWEQLGKQPAAVGGKHSSSPTQQFGCRWMTSVLSAFYLLSICICSLRGREKLTMCWCSSYQDKNLSKVQDPVCCQNINSNCLNLQVPNLLSTHYLEWDLWGLSRVEVHGLCSSCCCLRGFGLDDAP